MADIYEGVDAASLNTIYTINIGDRFFGSLTGEVWGGEEEDGDLNDYVRFVVAAGDTLSFSAEYLTGDYFFDIGVNVRDDDGDFVRRSDFTTIENNSSYTFLEGGTYYAVISAGDVFDGGTYRFELSYDDTPGEVDFVTPLETYFGEISLLGEVDLLKVNVEEGLSYRIILGGELIWGQFTLTDSGNDVIGEAAYVDGALSPVLIFSADETETLDLEISSNYPGEFDFGTGGYSVQLARIDIINGTDLADVLDGTDSADAMNGFAGNDTISGERGDDLIYGESGKDRVWDGKGADTVDLGDGNDYVRVGGGVDSFYGGEGKDYISYYDSRNGVTLDLGANEASGSWAVNDTIDGFESASGSRTGDDKITGSDESNTIRTYGGKDKVYAGQGEDRVYLGSGNDYVRVGGGKETFDGGSGKDYISYYDSSNGVIVDLAANEVTGSWANNDKISNFESVSGSKYGFDILSGTDGANTLRGYGGSDKLYGRGGDDRIVAGAGRDKLYGGTGADVFEFRPDEGLNQILDFEAGIDTIRLVGFELTMDDLSGMGEGIDGGAYIEFSAQNSISINSGTFAELLASIELV